MKKISILLFSLFLIPVVSNAAVSYSDVINLAPGWNIVSTPRVLDSHSFSLPETSNNFEIYALNPADPSGWSTLASLGQTEFTPLFGYFINNESSSTQTLTFNYEASTTPDQRLFQTTFSTPGWYSFGIANPTYADATTDGTTNTGNPSEILNSIANDYDSVIDLTAENYLQNPNDVAVGDVWQQAIAGDINSLNDFRDDKGYVIHIDQPNSVYAGFQNNGIPQPSVLITANGISASTTVAASSSIDITWTSSNASSCSISPDNSSGITGTENISISTTTIYSVSCVGLWGGVATSSVTINIASPGSFGGLTLAENAAYSNQTLTANTTGFLIGSYTLSANSSGAINVTGLTVGLTGTLPLTSVANLYTSVNSTKQNPQSTNNVSANFTIPANGSQVVNVYADIGSLPSVASYTAGLTVTAGGVASTTINGVAIAAYGSTAPAAATALIALINGTTGIAGVTATASSTNTSALVLSNTAATTVLSGANTTLSGQTAGALSLQSNASATLKSTLQVTANGATSNAVASSGTISGQNLTVGTGTLNTPTLTSDTPVSQLVVGGTSGSDIMNLGFTSLIGAATITELDFTSTSSAITSITVGGVTQAFAGTTATTSVSGLNISIPVQNANVEVPVTVSYATVGNNGIASNATTTLLLTHVKYTTGNASKDLYPVVSSNAVYAVAGYPNISIVTGTSNSLTAGTNQIAQVTVQAVGNTVNLLQLPIMIAHLVTATTSGITVEVANTNTTIATSTLNGVGATTLTFTNGGYQISAGQTVTFDILANVGDITNSGNGDSLTTQLGAATSVNWGDVNGGATGLTAQYIPSYSTTNAYTINNN